MLALGIIKEMITSISKAIHLLLHPTSELLDILSKTAIMALSSSIIALILGVLLGLWLGTKKGKLRDVLVVVNRTLVGMPPVVLGLILFMFCSGVGPLRHLGLLFTIRLMIIAQVLLITPLVASNMETYIQSIIDPFKETCIGLKLDKKQQTKLLLNECSYQIFTSYLLAFSRSIAEVGAVSMVGGAIAWKTNVMTTAIMTYTNKGDFTLGVALGLILLVLSLIVNVAVSLLQRRFSK